MKKSILALSFLLFTGIAFSQTTVTLQDQCNCEVLKGIDVSSAGATSPTGADLGDIYVNTSSGTIYFWDGDSWELTSTDDQQLTGFNFDDVTNILSLSLEDGGNVNVDLSSLKDIFTDSNTAVTSFDIDGTNTNLVITDSEANTFSVALADLAALIDTNTDDQAITAFSLDNTTNELTLTLEDGGTETVDFSTLLAAAGTDDQALSLSGNTLTLENGGTVDLGAYLDNTDDQAITAFSLDNTTNELTLTLEDGGTETVDFSTVLAAAGTDDQALSLSGNTLTLENGGTVDLGAYLDNTDDQAITAFSLDNATNELTLTLEDGGTETVDFSTVLAVAGTDDQNLTLSGNNLSIEDGNFVDLSGYMDNTDDQALSLSGNILTLENGGTVDLGAYLDNTDDQAITAFSLDNATNELTLTLEDGGTETVDFSTVLAAAGTDDQNLTLTGNNLSIEDGNFVDLSGYMDNTDDQELSLSGNTLTLENGGTVDLGAYLDNTDDQTITAFSLDNTTNELTLTLEDGGTEIVDFSTVLAAAGTDDQNLTLSGNNLSIEDGNFVDLSGYMDNTDDQELSLSGNTLTLENGGTVDLGAYLDNTDNQTITAFSLDNATNELTLTLEDGGTEIVDFSTVLAAAGTDDQNLTLSGNNLSIEDGNFVDLSGYMDNTDDQALSLSGNILTLENGGTVDLGAYLDNTDDQAITAFSLDNTTNELTLTLEDGGTETVDFSTVLAAAGTDDQNLTLTGNNLSIEDGNFVDLSGYMDNTDDQELSLSGNTLTLENGGTVDLGAYLDNTDDQNAIEVIYDNTTSGLSSVNTQAAIDELKADVDAFAATSGQTNTASNVGAGGVGVFARKTGADLEFKNINASSNKVIINNDGANDEIDIDINEANLTITESQISDLNHTVDTDEQTLTLSGNILSIDNGNSVDLTAYLDNTDDQAITAFSLDNTTNELTLTLEDGGTETVDFSTVLAAAGTDDQNLTLTGNNLSIEDGNFVDLSGYMDNTDDQELSLSGNTLTLENGGTVDLGAYLDNTDDQTITAFSLDNTTNELTLTLEDGGTEIVDFSTVLAAAGTDDQNLTLSGNNLSIEDGNFVDLSGYMDNTDDQELSLSGNTLTLENGGTVDLGAYLDNTDNQTITAFSLDNATNELTLTLEDGGTEIVDFSTVLAAAGTDDQALSLSGNTLTLENGGTVDLGAYLDNTDDQTITAFSLDNTTNELTLTLEDGGTEIVDFSTVLAAAGTDDQNLTLSGNNLSIEDGNFVDLSGYMDNTDDQELSLSGNTLTLENGGTVDLGAYLDNTDNQTITAFSLDNATNELTLTLEDGGTEIVDFSTVLAAAGTDDQALSLSGNTLTLENGGTVDLGAYLDNTDDQTITAFSLDNTTNELTLTLEDGGTEIVDFSTVLAAAGTDDQNLTLSGNNLSIEDGNFVDLSGYMDNTDDQALSLSGNTLTLENGGTVDLGAYLDNTDDQTITAFSLDNTTNELTLTLEDGGTEIVDFSTVLAAAGTDDQNLTLSGNNLSIEDGNFVDLSGYMDNTDDQALSLSGNTLTLENGGTVDLGAYLDNTDDQTITAFSLDNATNELTLTLEDGGTETVNFSTVLAAAGTDDQNLTLSGNNLSIEDGNFVDLSGYMDNTDDQALSLSGNTLTLENGGTVDLGAYLDNTDDQTITAFSLDNATNELTLTLEDGGTETVNFSTVLAAAGTDDQALSLSGNILTLESGGTVDLGAYLDNTDDQAITTFSLDNATNELTFTLEDGGTETVDFSTVLAAAGTDDQALSLSGNTLTLENGGTVDLGAYLDNTDDQAITAFSLDNTTNELTLTLEDGGTETVDFSTVLAAAGTDDQNLTLTGNNLSIEDGNFVDLSGYMDNTDDQELSLSGNTLTLENGGTVDLGAYLDNTDDQTITAFSLDNTTNELTLTLEDGGTEIVDFSTVLAAAGTDDQNLTLSGNNLSIEDGNFVDLSGYMDNTDDQALSLSGDILTLENGGNVDLAAYLDNTDNQDASEVNSDSPVDVDGDGNTEATVEDVIQDIAPITSKAARIFYPPSIAIDASSNGTDRTLNLYSQYVAQYGSPAVVSAGAPAAIPTYGPTELYYYITYADPTVFDNMVIDANGELTYDIIGQPADYNALINVVFVVK